MKRYRVVDEIGRGATATIYKAVDREIGELVALKVFHVAGPDERFRRELLLARNVTHRNVCRLHSLGESRGRLYIAMEYVDGRTLADCLHWGPLSQEQTRRIGAQVAAGLGAIHEAGIIHRDLKPSNVMLERDGRIVLMDFGAAYRPDLETLTDSGEAMGTLWYLSPEQAKGEELGPGSDIYALGLLLWEMLTGCRPPGDGGRVPLGVRRIDRLPPPSAFGPVSSAMDAIVLRCLEREPENRYRAATEVEADLSSTQVEKLKWSPRRHWPSVAACALVAVGLSWFGAGKLEERPPGPTPAITADDAMDMRWKELNERGIKHLWAGEYEDAERCFRAVIELRPSSDKGYLNLAAVFMVQGKWDLAEPWLRAALNIQPSADAYNNLGYIAYNLGSYEEAVVNFKQATRWLPEKPLPDSYMPWGGLGDAYRQLGRDELAREAYEESARLARGRLAAKPEDANAKGFLVMVDAALGRCARLELPADAGPLATYYAAIAAELCGDRAAALQYARLALEGGAVVDIETNPDLAALRAVLWES